MPMNIPNILTLLRLLAAPSVALIFAAAPRPLADQIALLLFVAASLTDWLDGYLARKWNQTSKFGAMLDPIADKAMVVIALALLVALFGLTPLIVVPVALILFREVFVSGLREFLGDTAGTLKVTKLAKWKTTAQMCAIAVLLAFGIAQHALLERTIGMDDHIVAQILEGTLPDPLGLNSLLTLQTALWFGGLVLLWIAALLTVLTGADYLRKAMPYLRDET